MMSPYPHFQLVQTSPGMGGDRKFNLLQMGSGRSQLVELNQKNMTLANMVMSTDNNHIMIGTQPKSQTVRSSNHQILKAQLQNHTKVVTTSAGSMQHQQKIIFTNGINNNPTVMRKGQSPDQRSEQIQGQIQGQGQTLIGRQLASVMQSDNRYTIPLKNGQGHPRQIISQIPISQMTQSPMVFYPSHFPQGTYHSPTLQATTNQIRDVVNNNQHHHGLQKSAMPQFASFQLIPNNMSQMTMGNPIPSQVSGTQGQVHQNAQGQNEQLKQMPNILNRKRPPPQPHTERRIINGYNPTGPAKMAKLDVDPVQIKVVPGQQAAQQMPTISASLAEPILPQVVTGATNVSSPNRANYITAKVHRVSESEEKLENTQPVNELVNHELPVVDNRVHSVIRSPRKPRKQTLIRTQDQAPSPASLARLSVPDPSQESPKVLDDVSTDEADEFEDENPAMENRNNQLRLEIVPEQPAPIRDAKVGQKRVKTLSNSDQSHGGKVQIISASLDTLQGPPPTDNPATKKCFRLRISNTQFNSKKDRDSLKHFAKHSDVRLTTNATELELPRLRILAKSTQSKVQAVNRAIRQMQKDESKIFSILENIKSKMCCDGVLVDIFGANVQRAKEGVYQLNESHAAACRLLSHYLKVEKPEKKEIPLLKKLMKKAKQKM